MAQTVDFPLDDGGSITVEVDPVAIAPTAAGPVTRSGRTADVVTSASQTFEQALGGIAPAARALVSELRAVGDPSEIVVEFAIKLSADAGVIVARTGGEANFRVTLTWSHR